MNDLEEIKNENEKLKKTNENRSDLISASAHQLRTSLSAMKWTLKMFLDEDLGQINDKQKDYLRKAISRNDRSIELVNYLLIFNHSENAEIAIEFTKIDITKTLDKIIDEFSGELKNKNIDLALNKFDPSIPYLNCDEKMITVAIQNLIENAIKYSDVSSKIQLAIDYNSHKNEISISVNDQGIGINKEDKEKIFDKFFRAPNAIKKEEVGSGLGLFVTKNIVEKHNGKIWFDSSEESGTTFFITLPIF